MGLGAAARRKEKLQICSAIFKYVVHLLLITRLGGSSVEAKVFSINVTRIHKHPHTHTQNSCTQTLHYSQNSEWILNLNLNGKM